MAGDRERWALGPLEAEVMTALWRTKRALTVREVLELLNADRAQPLAYTTVMTVLSRLHDKNIVGREAEGRGFRYSAAVDDEAEIAVRSVVREFGDAALAGFVEEVRADRGMLARLQALLGEPE